ncbi:MAG: cobalamin-dependent protein [Actinomycetota bacterium]|nr:cobalamin-dependent protein [Actinomycetota bacterium]
MGPDRLDGAAEDVEPPLAEAMTLQAAADALRVHYMTAYRYVRLGLLPATKVAGSWEVPQAEVDRLLAERAPDKGARPAGGRGVQPAPWAARLEARLRAGDERGSWGVVEGALSAGMEPPEVYVDLLVPSLRGIGEAWAAGEIDVGVEHRASVIAMRLVGRLGPRFNRRGQTRGSVVLGAPPGDRHGLPSALLADLVRGIGFTVADLGADTPVDSFVRAAQDAERLVAVAVGVTTPDNDGEVRALADGLHRALPDVPVLIGGAGVRDEAHAHELGADGWAPDGPAALALLEQVVSR